MKRREFIGLIGSAAAFPLAAQAQSTDRMPLVALETAFAQDDRDGNRIAGAFQQALNELGWRPGQNVHIEYRWGATNPEQAQKYAAELIKLKPDVIVAHTTIVTRAFSQQTTAIPIVFTNVSDPIGEHFVRSLAHPGGDITGFTNSRQWEQNTCSSLRKSPRALPGWPCSSIRIQRRGKEYISPIPSKLPVPSFRYSRSKQQFRTSET